MPLTSGDRIYTARLAEALGRAGTQVHVLGLANPEAPDADAAPLDPVVRWETVPGHPNPALRALASREPLVGARFATAAYRRRLKALLAGEPYDAVILDQYGLAWALPLIDRHARGRPAIVHIAHDFETEVTRGIAGAWQGGALRGAALRSNARRTARAERRLAARSDLIVTLTEIDRDHFARIGAKGRALVLPPGYDGPRRAARTIDVGTPRRVALVGSYRWTAKQINLERFLDAADAILADAGIELLIVGDVPEELRARRAAGLRAGRFLGFAEDLPALLDGCRMGLVVEAVGGGFKLKVLDYVMTRTPVAALAPALAGQASGLVESMIVAEDAPALARAIVDAVDDLPRLNASQEQAFAFAAERYDWDRNGTLLAGAIRDLAR